MMVVLPGVAVAVIAVSVVVVESAFGELVASSASFVAVASFVAAAFVAPQKEEEGGHSGLCLPLLRHQTPGNVSIQNPSQNPSCCWSRLLHHTPSWTYVYSS